MGLIQEIGKGPVGLDTCVFIYYIQEHPLFFTMLQPLFEAIDRKEIAAATSALTLMEVLVVPFRSGNQDLAQRYEAILTRSRGLELVVPDLAVFRSAAFLRARSGIRTPDALQLAAALSARCGSFLTNDRKLKGPGNLRILQLSAYAEP